MVLGRQSFRRKLFGKLSRIGWDLLKVDFIRYRVCKWRWMLFRYRLKIDKGHGAEVAQTAIAYNLSAFSQPGAAFGMGKRMGIILYPVVALLREKPGAKVLIIGPRTEDDILWARALGLSETRGLDLFSYSDLVDVGDMHRAPYEDHAFDAVLFGWVLFYSHEPAKAIQEAKRLLKPGGLLAVGMQSLDAKDLAVALKDSPNHINDLDALGRAVNEEILFSCDPKLESTHEVGMVFRLR